MEALAPTAIFALIIENLLKAIARRGHQGAFLWICRGYPDSGPFTIRLFGRIRRTAARFARLVARLQTEAPRPVAPLYAPRRASAARSRPAPRRDAPELPRSYAWLRPRVFEAGACGSQLDHLFMQPGVAELIASDYRFGRILRPLCHMLGVRPPVIARAPRAAPSLTPPSLTPPDPAPPDPAPPDPDASAPVGAAPLPPPPGGPPAAGDAECDTECHAEGLAEPRAPPPARPGPPAPPLPEPPARGLRPCATGLQPCAGRFARAIENS